MPAVAMSLLKHQLLHHKHLLCVRPLLCPGKLRPHPPPTRGYPSQLGDLHISGEGRKQRHHQHSGESGGQWLQLAGCWGPPRGAVRRAGVCRCPWPRLAPGHGVRGQQDGVSARGTGTSLCGDAVPDNTSVLVAGSSPSAPPPSARECWGSRLTVSCVDTGSSQPAS